MLSSRRAQLAITRFYQHTYAVIAVLFALHLVFFAVFLVFLDNQRAYVYETDSAGRGLNNAYRWAARPLPKAERAVPAGPGPRLCQESCLLCLRGSNGQQRIGSH